MRKPAFPSTYQSKDLDTIWILDQLQLQTILWSENIRWLEPSATYVGFHSRQYFTIYIHLLWESLCRNTKSAFIHLVIHHFLLVFVRKVSRLLKKNLAIYLNLLHFKYNTWGNAESSVSIELITDVIQSGKLWARKQPSLPPLPACKLTTLSTIPFYTFYNYARCSCKLSSFLNEFVIILYFKHKK